MSASETETWWRERIQRLANETGEVWLLLNGFCHKDYSRDTVSSMTLIHGVPKSVATPQERSQAIEEFHPKVQITAEGTVEPEATA